MESSDREQLHTLPTPELLRHAVDEARMLAKAEVLHAKAELRQELQAAKVSGVLLGAAGALGICALALLFAAAGVALPLPRGVGLLIVAVVVLAVGGALGFSAYRKLPRKPLPLTQQRLKEDVRLAREQFA